MKSINYGYSWQYCVYNGTTCKCKKVRSNIPFHFCVLAKTVNDTGVDLVIGYVSYHSVHQLHRLFGKDKGEWRIGNGSSSIGDMVWFVALQNQPPLPGCLGYRDVVLPSDSVTGQRTAEALVVIIRQLQWKHLTLLYHPKYGRVALE